MQRRQADTSALPLPDGTPVGESSPATPGLRRALGGRLGGAFAALAVPNYRLLFQGNFATQIGYGMQQVAFGWLILDLSGDPFYLGLNGFAFMFPMLVISPFGGVIADRFERQRVLMASQLVLMVTAIVIAVLVYLRWATVWNLLALSLVIGTANSINVPSRQALVADIVGKDLLANAVSLHSLSLNTSRIIGPSLAGGIIALIGVFGCFAAQAVGYVWSVANIAMMRITPRVQVAHRTSALESLLEGFRYCRQNRLVFSMLMLGSAVSMLAMPAYMQLLPSYARDTLGLDADGLGLLLSVAGVGAFTSSMVLTAAGKIRRRGLLLIGSALLMGILLSALALVQVAPVAALLLGGVSACSSVLMILNNTVLQETVPDHLRGRVMSAYMITWGTMPLGAVPLGAIAGRFGTPTAMLIGGICCIVAAAWVAAARSEVRSI